MAYIERTPCPYPNVHPRYKWVGRSETIESGAVDVWMVGHDVFTARAHVLSIDGKPLGTRLAPTGIAMEALGLL